MRSARDDGPSATPNLTLYTEYMLSYIRLIYMVFRGYAVQRLLYGLLLTALLLAPTLPWLHGGPEVRVLVLCDTPCTPPRGLRVIYQLQALGHGFLAALPLNSVGWLESYGEVYVDRPLELSQLHLEVIGVQPLRKIPAFSNLTGRDVKIAVIDTGVNYMLPELGGGIGPQRRVVGGWDFFQGDDAPLDTSGHGTAVAFLILQVAPEAKLLAYRVGSMNYVDLNSVYAAMDRAVADGASIINLSLGTRQRDPLLLRAVAAAHQKGALVVVAAGNSSVEGDDLSTPATSPHALAVGASTNPTQQAVFVDAEFDPPLSSPPELLLSPDAPLPTSEIRGELVFVGLARTSDVQDLDLTGKVALAERGGPLPEGYFFSKERNVAERGAKALIIFNNRPGLFSIGLISPVTPEGYRPRIPVFSMARAPGLELAEMLRRGEKVIFHLHGLRRNWEFVAEFSSRGPADQFTVKPEVVAPGVYFDSINASGKPWPVRGTSFSTPLVSGLAALVRQARPDYNSTQITRLLMTSSDILKTPRGQPFPIYSQGAGRVNISRAITSGLEFSRSSVVVNLGPSNPRLSVEILVREVGERLVEWELEWPNPGVQIEVTRVGPVLKLTFSTDTLKVRTYEGWLHLRGTRDTYHLPLIAHVNDLEIGFTYRDGRYSLFVSRGPGLATYDFMVRDPIGSTQLFSGTTGNITFTPRSSGTHYVEVKGRDALGGLHRGALVLHVGQAAPPARLVSAGSIAVIGYTLLILMASLVLVAIILHIRERAIARRAWASPPSQEARASAGS
jgi:minor extracellular serine protease Vpr